MVITTITNLPPPIIQHFNRFLLDFLLGLLMMVGEKIIPLSVKKIRPQDVGKRREFDLLHKEFTEVYERKKAEEAEYKSKVKKASEKVPRLPNSSGTMRFKRFRSKEQTS